MMANFSCYYSIDYGPLHPFDDTWETQFINYEGGSESSVIGVITLLIDIIGCCIIP